MTMPVMYVGAVPLTTLNIIYLLLSNNILLAKARCYATRYAGLYRRLHRFCLGPAPTTVAEDRRAAMGVPKWYLYIGYYCLVTFPSKSTKVS